MSAKLKDHLRYTTGHKPKHKPAKIKAKDYQKVYWPFLPVLAILWVLAVQVARTVPVHHLTHRVLAYQTSQDVQELLKETNLQRQQDNEKPLALDNQLTQAAQAKANDMSNRNYWSHVTPEGIQPWSFVTATGYKYQALGENLAAGFPSDDAVVAGWMASPHHRDNILNANYSQVGFGYANNANYTSAGGGPMTIVVAFYGEPTGGLISSNQPSLTAKTSPSLLSGNALAANTDRAQTVWSGRLASWAPYIMVAALAVSLGLFMGRHAVAMHRLATRGERYIWEHKATDVALLLIAICLFLLAQTAGYIQ